MKQIWTHEQKMLLGRALQAYHLGKGFSSQAIAALSGTNWIHRDEVIQHMKATQNAQSTTTFTAATTRVEQSFALGIASMSVSMLPGLALRPSATRLYVDSTGAIVSGDVVGEGEAVPVLQGGSWSQVFLGMQGREKKAGAISVQTRELLESNDGASAIALAETLALSVAQAIDNYTLAPNLSGSWFDGIAMMNPTGATGAAVETDLLQLARVLPGSHLPGCVFLMTPETNRNAVALRTSGVRTFPDLRIGGGTIFGIPVFVSPALAFTGSPTQDCIALVNPARIYWLSDMRATFRTSTETAIEMSDAPGSKSTATATAANIVSMFQTNSAALHGTARFDYHVTPNAIVAMRSAI